jgi:hypothetical protein
MEAREAQSIHASGPLGNWNQDVPANERVRMPSDSALSARRCMFNVAGCGNQTVQAR